MDIVKQRRKEMWQKQWEEERFEDGGTTEYKESRGNEESRNKHKWRKNIKNETWKHRPEQHVI